MGEFTHFDDSGASRMVDVSSKAKTLRTARAEATVLMQPSTLRILRNRGFSKGDVLEVARLAGIMGAKKTAEMIPLCHIVPLDAVEVTYDFPDDKSLRIESRVTCEWKTGVEMEALTTVSVCALTVYDMCKSVDRAMEIQSVRLLEKTGGRSGHFERDAASRELGNNST